MESRFVISRALVPELDRLGGESRDPLIYRLLQRIESRKGAQYREPGRCATLRGFPGTTAMTLVVIKEQLGAADLVPIFVSNEPPGDGNRLAISGGLPEYLQAVQAASAKVVIVYSRKFVEQFFLHDPYESSDESAVADEEDEEAVVDLSLGIKAVAAVQGKRLLVHLRPYL